MKLGSVMFVLSLGAFTTAADAAESKLKLPLGLQESAAFIPDDIAICCSATWVLTWRQNSLAQ